MVDERWINDLGLGSGILAVEDTGPVSVTLRASGSTPLAHTTRITLTRDSRRIGISNEITQNFGGVHTWSFGFNLNAPDTWHEEIGAVARAKLTTAGGHYYPTHSRLDWLSLNHFAAMTGADGVGITLSSADCSFMKLGASAQVDGIARLDTATPQISVLAGGQVDGPGTGIPNQGGDSRFLQRFALQSHGAFSAAESMRFALEHQNPLVTGRVRGCGPYPEKSFSLVTISDPDVLLWSLKPAEEGISKGVIARVWNVASEPKQFSLRLQPGISAARRATHIETDLGPAPITGGALSVSIGRAQLLTFRLVR